MMSCKFYCLLKSGLQAACDGILHTPFGTIGKGNSDETYAIIDCCSTGLRSIYPALDAFVPGSYPTEIAALAVDPENMTKAEAKAVLASDYWKGI